MFVCLFFTTSFIQLLAALRTTEQQQRFHDICGNLVKTQRRVVGWWKRLCALKEEKPKMVKNGRHSALTAHCLVWTAGPRCRICFLLSAYYNAELSVLQIKISSAD